MSLAEKIILQRKKQGWSQEELADRMDVSRQAVSKWESSQSVPDMEKVVMLSNIFGVTTDYLLKDEEGEAFHSEKISDSKRYVSAEEACRYLDTCRKTSVRVAAAVFLCYVTDLSADIGWLG